VPARVKAAIRRGLAADPDARWPSMEELLAELRRDPNRAFLTVAIAIVAAVLAGTLTLALVRAGHPLAIAPPPCSTGLADIAGVWTDDLRAHGSDAFKETNLPYAADAFAHVDRALTERTLRWASAHDRICAATRVRGDQSERLLDLRMACLARARAALVADARAVAHADATTVEHAASLARDDGELDACDDVSSLSALVPRPTDPDARTRLAAIEVRVAELESADRAGHYTDGLAAEDAVIADARAIGWAPILADALHASGQIEDDGGDTAVAEARLRDALVPAAEGRADVTSARALVDLVYVVGFREARAKDAQLLMPLAYAAVARAGSAPALRAQLFHVDGNVRQQLGDHEGALGKYKDARAIVVGEQGSDSSSLIALDLDVADALRELDRTPEALPLYREALALSEGIHGAEHPTTAAVLTNYGTALRELGELDEASSVTERALAIRERVHGKDHPKVATALYHLGLVRLDQGRLDDARPLLERALAIRERSLGPKHPSVAVTLAALGDLAERQGRYDDALELHQRALAIKIEVDGPDHPSVAYSCQSLGNIYGDLGRLKEARAQYACALRIREHALGSDAPDTMEPVIELAKLDLGEGKTVQATRDLERALGVEEHAFGKDSPLLEGALVALVDARLAAGDQSAASELAERAATIAAGHPREIDAATDGAVRFAKAKALWARGGAGDRALALKLADEARDRLATEPGDETRAQVITWLASREREKKN
jgi:tetratricopeptide (TPR) repeat protein